MTTYIIIIITAIFSVRAFNNRTIVNRLIFHPPSVKGVGWYRFFSYGIIHADWNHLIFNMLTLYFFGPYIETYFINALGALRGISFYLILYVSALFISIYPTFLKEKNNRNYYGLGASGAVSAIVFAYILIEPMGYMGIIFIPVFIPAFLFGILYVVLSLYFTKQSSGGINHLAHITGAVYGVLFTFLVMFLISNSNLATSFWASIQGVSLQDVFKVSGR